MIQINLLKQPQRKSIKRIKLSRKSIIIASSVVGVLLLSIIGWRLFLIFKSSLKKDDTKITVKDDFSPSTYLNPKNVEEVVRDINKLNDKLDKRGFLKIPYDEMSSIEKINYEIHFSKNVCDLLTRTAIPGIDFKNLEVDSYNTLIGIGLCDIKENVIKLFKSLKREKVEILPKPQSIIRKQHHWYQFTISSVLPEFGLNFEAPFFLGPNDLPDHEDLDLIIKKMVQTAKNDNIKITSGPNRVESYFKGDYRQFRYQLKGKSSYTDFVIFINSLYNRQIPCSFQMFKLKAEGKNILKIEADIVFTTSY